MRALVSVVAVALMVVAVAAFGWAVGFVVHGPRG